jgi:hypothetical protein
MIMAKQFEVRWQGDLTGTPQQVWDAFTVHTAAWYWKIQYQPKVGGTERGLSSNGGTVTVWEPHTHFTTRAEGDGEFFNQLDYRLEPHADGTRLALTHQGVFGDDDYDHLLDACQHHTPLYYHSLTEYLRHFADRDATYIDVNAPAGSDFTTLLKALGVPDNPAVGDTVRLTPEGMDPIDGVIDYATHPFLGVRTPDALYRFFGRDTWGWPVGVAMHLYRDDIDEDATRTAWNTYLTGLYSN